MASFGRLYVRALIRIVVLGPRGQPRLLDQALVIRALLDASAAISANVYKNEAIDLLAATNSSFFRPGNAFYSDRPDSNECSQHRGVGRDASRRRANEAAHEFEAHLGQWKRAIANPGSALCAMLPRHFPNPESLIN
jgi:hypothetical protein